MHISLLARCPPLSSEGHPRCETERREGPATPWLKFYSISKLKNLLQRTPISGFPTFISLSSVCITLGIDPSFVGPSAYTIGRARFMKKYERTVWKLT